MSAVPKRTLSAAEYLAAERAAAFKSEFYQGEMFAMAGTSWEHTCIKGNLETELNLALRGSGCRTLSSDLRVKVNRTGLYTYPDVVLVCGEPQLEDEGNDTLLNPRVIFEVLSPTTEGYDRGLKFAQYQQIATLQEYVLVAQNQVRIERYTRQPDDTWNLTTFADPAGTFTLTSVPAAVPLAAVYRDVRLPPYPAR